MSLFQWLGTILVSGGVSWLVAWYQLRRHEDIEAKKEHLDQIKHDLVEPLVDALNSNRGITRTHDVILVRNTDKGIKIPITFFENVKRYHFPELCILDEYLSVQQELQDINKGINERLKLVVKKAIADALRGSPLRQYFQACTHDFNFELALEKAVYSFLDSNLPRLDKWDWREDFNHSFNTKFNSGFLEVWFNQYLVYKEPAPKGTSAENWAGPVNVLLFSIIDSLVNSVSVKQIAEDLAKLEQQRSEKRNELKKVLEHIKYVQKLPLRKRRWRILKEPCPCLKDY